MDYTLLILFAGQLLGQSVYSVIAPFFPPIASDIGLNQTLIGVIFSGYPIASSLFGPIFGVLILKLGRKKIFFLSCILISVSLLGFAFVPYMDKWSLFVCGLISRIIQGIGGVGLSASSFAIIASNYHENMETILGIQQSMGALGMMIGPILGSILYPFTGFTFLFVIYGALFAVFLPFILTLLPTDKLYSGEDKGISIWKILGDKVVLLVAMNCIFSMMLMAALEPTLTIHLDKAYDIHETLAGIFFAIPTVSYIVAVGVKTQLFHRLNRNSVISLGILFNAMAFLLMGPWDKAGIPSELWITITGLIALGFGICWCNVPALPLMINSTIKRLPDYDPKRISDTISSFITSCFQFGLLAGPPVAGAMADNMGFPDTAGLIAVATLIFLFLFMFAMGNISEILFCAPIAPEDSVIKERLLEESQQELVYTKKPEDSNTSRISQQGPYQTRAQNLQSA